MIEPGVSRRCAKTIPFPGEGARNTSDIIERWPQYRDALVPVRDAILAFRAKHGDLQELSNCCGLSPAREPPLAQTVDKLRVVVAKALGLIPKKAAKHHAASSWRYNLVKRVMKLAGDPDHHVPRWLEQGFPVGIREPIVPSGLLPLVKEEAGLSPEALKDSSRWENNHKSFDLTNGEDKPAHDLLADLVNQGFAFLFRDRSDAERWLGSPVVVSPLGDVTKPGPTAPRNTG